MWAYQIQSFKDDGNEKASHKKEYKTWDTYTYYKLNLGKKHDSLRDPKWID